MSSAGCEVTAPPPNFGLRMAVFFGGFFLINGVAMPFFPVWLAGRGLSEVEIGSIIAIPLAVRVLLTPFGGMVADRLPNRRFAIRVFTFPAAFAFAAAWPYSDYWPILLLTGLAFTLWAFALPGAEALALTGVRRFGLDYGRMRLWGSVAFISANLGSGALLVFMPRESIFWFIVIAFVLAAAASLLLPVTPRAVRLLDDAARPQRKSAWFILSRPSFLLLILTAGLIASSHAAFYGFGSLYWQGLGFSTLQIGGFWAVSLGCEIAFFVWSTALNRRLGPFGMLALGGVAAVVRWIGLSFDFGVVGFALIQSLHAFTFGAVFLGTQHAVARSVPDEYAASAQGMVVMVGGLLMAGMTAISGSLFEAIGSRTFLVMVIPAALSLVTLSILRRLPSTEEGVETNEKGAAEAAP